MTEPAQNTGETRTEYLVVYTTDLGRRIEETVADRAAARRLLVGCSLDGLEATAYERQVVTTAWRQVAWGDGVERRWDIGDPEPGDVTEVFSVHFDDTDEYNSAVPLRFGRTYDGQWKTYLFGGKSYYDWDELVRRFGPVSEVQ